MARILVIENEHALQTLYAMELQSMGHEVQCLGDGRTAFAQVDRLCPQLIIMDIAMPNGDGLEFLHRLIGQHHAIPIIIHSGHVIYQDEWIVQAADAFVLKSSDLTEFKNTIHQTLTMRSNHA